MDEIIAPKHVELIKIINKLLLHLIGYLYHCITDIRYFVWVRNLTVFVMK